MNGPRFGLSMGGLVDPIAKQLSAQGIHISDEDAGHLQRDADAIVRLRIRGVLSEGESRKACGRLMKKIGQVVRRATGGDDV